MTLKSLVVVTNSLKRLDLLSDKFSKILKVLKPCH